MTDTDSGRLQPVPPKEVLYESPHVRVIHQPRNDTTVYITFNEIGRCVDGLEFWGERALAQEGVGAIGVMSASPNWFPHDPRMVEAIQQTVVQFGYQHVVTYGHSQGGYGALRYSSALSADLTIASSPQWSISPAKVSGHDDRFVNYYSSAVHDDMHIRSGDASNTAYLLFDPRSREDAWHAAQISKHIEVIPVLAPFTGHSGIGFATAAGIGRALIHVMSERLADRFARAATARQLLRKARASSIIYWIERSKALTSRPNTRRQALAALIRAMDEADGDPAAMAEIAHLYIQLGDPDQGALLAQQAAAIVESTAIHDVLRIWDAMDRIGQGARSLDMMRLAVAAVPDNTFLRLHLVKTLLDLRNTVTLEARHEVRLAAAHARASPMLWKHIEHACGVLDQRDVQLEAQRRLAELENADAHLTADAGIPTRN